MEPAPEPERTHRKRRIPAWVITVVGFVVSSIVGIVVGYLVVTRLFPDHGLPRLW